MGKPRAPIGWAAREKRSSLDYPLALANDFMCSARAWQPSMGMALYTEARLPPTVRYPFRATSDLLDASFRNFSVASSLGSRKVMFMWLRAALSATVPV